VVDQKEEEAHAHEAQQNRDENVELRDGVVLDAGERGDRVEVREDEHRETDLQAPLAEHAGDDPRRQLTTRDLDGEEDHREREHDEPGVDATSAPSAVRAPSGVNPRRVQRVAASRPRTSGAATSASTIPASGMIHSDDAR